MKIVTSYYANIKNLPEDYTLISISGRISEDILNAIDIHDKALAPSWSIFKDYKETYDTEVYEKRFVNEVLPNINLKHKLKEWQEISGNDKFALLCYETPNDFCHRHIVAEAFNEIGFEVKEYKKPEEITSLNDF